MLPSLISVTRTETLSWRFDRLGDEGPVPVVPDGFELDAQRLTFAAPPENTAAVIVGCERLVGHGVGVRVDPGEFQAIEADPKLLHVIASAPGQSIAFSATRMEG